jgi:hypothetical protein
MNADEPNHNGHTTSGPQTLLPKATVTIRFDGLIYTAYDKGQRLYQAAVHSVNGDHELNIEVRVEGNPEPLFPNDEKWPDWDPEYAGIKPKAPFWIYVDSGNGLNPKEFSAQLYLPAEPDERSFDRILNFESLYGRKITLDTSKFVEFNFPHGTCYSAENKKATLTRVDEKENPISEEQIIVSRKGAIDIDLVSDQNVKREIVLMNKDRKKLFYFPLENGKHYFIDVFNQPKDPPGNGHEEEHENHGQENHFIRYYDLFQLQGNEQKFLVFPENVVNPAAEANSPPCISGSGDRLTGLP